MRWLRFYYFTFLYHYRNKSESWGGDFRSVLLVELSLFWLVLGIWLMIDPWLEVMGSWTKPIVLIINLFLLAFLYTYLMYKGKSEVIFKEFEGHHINNQTNRTICWIVWAGSFILFLISATLQ